MLCSTPELTARHGCLGVRREALDYVTAVPHVAFPPDALCKRLEVDNSNRALHGALLDAGLLAEVYIRMTRGQNSLVIDAAEASAADTVLQAIDFAAFDLPVLQADTDDLAAHSAMLAELDKESGGKTTWKTAVA